MTSGLEEEKGHIEMAHESQTVYKDDKKSYYLIYDPRDKEIFKEGSVKRQFYKQRPNDVLCDLREFLRSFELTNSIKQERQTKHMSKKSRRNRKRNKPSNPAQQTLNMAAQAKADTATNREASMLSVPAHEEPLKKIDDSYTETRRAMRDLGLFTSSLKDSCTKYPDGQSFSCDKISGPDWESVKQAQKALGKGNTEYFLYLHRNNYERDMQDPERRVDYEAHKLNNESADIYVETLRKQEGIQAFVNLQKDLKAGNISTDQALYLDFLSRLSVEDLRAAVDLAKEKSK
jgi:hypothetical protein